MTENTISENLVKSKVCSKCGESFSLTSDFWHRDKNKKDGFHSICKGCRSKLKAKYRQENKVAISKYQAKYREDHKPERANYWQENKDKIANKRAKHYQENKNRLQSMAVQYYQKNNAKISKRRVDNRLELNNRIRIWAMSPAKHKTYSVRLSGIEKTRLSIKCEGCIEVNCAYCGRWFVPTNRQSKNRIYGINNNGGNQFYCSNICQDACPIFNQRKYPKRYRKATSREANPLLRQIVLKRDDYTCQKCGATIQEAQLHCHHVVPATQNPMTANDPDACITLCKSCHKEVHKKPGCGYHELRCDID